MNEKDRMLELASINEGKGNQAYRDLISEIEKLSKKIASKYFKRDQQIAVSEEIRKGLLATTDKLKKYLLQYERNLDDLP
jgi:hypothetical protein